MLVSEVLRQNFELRLAEPFLEDLGATQVPGVELLVLEESLLDVGVALIVPEVVLS